MKKFNVIVKELMKRDNISQKELAEKSGISESSISRYLSGELIPRMDILVNISKVFNVSVSYLVDDDEKEDSFVEIVDVVTRNRDKLTEQQKNELFKIILGGK